MSLCVSPADVRDRARAAFLGVAVGDALGATVEFLTPAEIRLQHGVHRDIVGGGWLHLRSGAVTDDTEMSLCIARAVDLEGGWSLAKIAEHFAAWLKSGPKDVGNTCRSGIRGYILDGTLERAPSQCQAGNGAAMRMVPVALLTLCDQALLKQRALEQGHLTHHHELSDSACFLIGRMIHMACLGLGRERLRRLALAVAVEQPRLRFVPYPGLSTAYIADTMQTVLHFFFATSSFEECLLAVVNQGGDADTTGAIAGGIAGAYYGMGGIPQRWLRKIDRHVLNEIDAVSERLFELSPLGNGVAPDIG